MCRSAVWLAPRGRWSLFAALLLALAWKIHRELYKTNGAFAHEHRTTIFKIYCTLEEANTSKPKPMTKSTDRMQIVDCAASLHMMREGCLFVRKRKTTQTTWSHGASVIVHSTKETRDYIQELGTHFYVKLVEASTSVLYLGRFCDALEYAYSWQPGGNPTSTKRQKRPSRAVPTVSFLSSRHSAERHSILKARPRQRKPCARYRSGRNHDQLLEPFSVSLIDDEQDFIRL